MTDREIDALVAEKVLGWRRMPVIYQGALQIWFLPKMGKPIRRAMHFCSDANADTLVLRRVLDRWTKEDVTTFYNDLTDLWCIRNPELTDHAACLAYRVGDYSRAALMTLGVNLDE